MTKGKSICNVLKTIRKQVADANGIKYEPRECHHQGECLGTCPACEAEVRYIEQQLDIRRHLGKAVAILGVSASLTALTSCAADNDIVTAPPTATAASASNIPVFSISNLPVEGEIVELMPSFPGGPDKLFEYLSKHVRYPKVAEKKGIEGKVIVSFVVEKNGKVSEATVVKSPDPSLSKEALRVTKSMPKWNPGKLNGQPTRTKYTVPFTFKLK